MKVIKTVAEMQQYANEARLAGKKIGLVPTMGYLHEGHMSLVDKARFENSVVVVSIFVNPTQFAPNEDLAAYPKDFEADRKKCQEASVDVIFYPDEKEMYPNIHLTWVDVDVITKKLCGKTRPTHFRGVATVVAKLFNIIKPNKAYFGQKDYQQSLVIIKMVKDLNFDVKIVTCPIVREKDGLAMSSRNKYLSSDERKEAVVLYQSLERAKWIITEGEKRAATIKFEMKQMIQKTSGEIEYIEVLNAKNLDNLDIIKGKVLVALAVKFGKARLIDNIVIDTDMSETQSVSEYVKKHRGIFNEL